MKSFTLFMILAKNYDLRCPPSKVFCQRKPKKLKITEVNLMILTEHLVWLRWMLNY